MTIQISNQAVITASTPIVICSANTALFFQVYFDTQACSRDVDVTVVYSAQDLTIGSTIYMDPALTIPTTYSAISNPNDSNNYFRLTGNTITSIGLCD